MKNATLYVGEEEVARKTTEVATEFFGLEGES
jgi:hypothetical protein